MCEENESFIVDAVEQPDNDSWNRNKRIIHILSKPYKEFEKAAIDISYGDNFAMYKKDDNIKGIQIKDKQIFSGTFTQQKQNDNKLLDSDTCMQQKGISIGFDNNTIKTIRVGDFLNEEFITLKINKQQNDNQKKKDDNYSCQVEIKIGNLKASFQLNNQTLSKREINNLIINEIENEKIQNKIKDYIKNNNNFVDEIKNDIINVDEIKNDIINQTKRQDKEKSWLEKIFGSCCYDNKEVYNKEIKEQKLLTDKNSMLNLNE